MKTEYICENCEYVASKWFGKCPQCGEWNTFVEREVVKDVPAKIKKARPNNDNVPQNSKATMI